jgi:hypothetical protein
VIIRLALVAALAACGATKKVGRVSADDAVFYVKSNVPEASVFVDGRYIGPVKIVRGGIAVVPGKHRLEIRHEDYFSGYVELELARAEKRKVDVQLARVLP